MSPTGANLTISLNNRLKGTRASSEGSSTEKFITFFLIIGFYSNENWLIAVYWLYINFFEYNPIRPNVRPPGNTVAAQLLMENVTSVSLGATTLKNITQPLINGFACNTNCLIALKIPYLKSCEFNWIKLGDQSQQPPTSAPSELSTEGASTEKFITFFLIIGFYSNENWLIAVYWLYINFFEYNPIRPNVRPPGNTVAAQLLMENVTSVSLGATTLKNITQPLINGFACNTNCLIALKIPYLKSCEFNWIKLGDQSQQPPTSAPSELSTEGASTEKFITFFLIIGFHSNKNWSIAHYWFYVNFFGSNPIRPNVRPPGNSAAVQLLIGNVTRWAHKFSRQNLNLFFFIVEKGQCFPLFHHGPSIWIDRTSKPLMWAADGRARSVSDLSLAERRNRKFLRPRPALTVR